VLYLAEVQKSKGVFGGGKAELKLLACQRADSWSAVPNEEMVPAEEANNRNPGVLVLVDLTANKQVQRLRQDTPGELLKILQNFSRQIDKYKKESEEIEQWKESLSFQSAELQRREEEMEAQREQFEQNEEKSAKLAEERQEMDSLREELAKSKAELEQNRQELDAAQAEFEATGKLDEGQAQHLQELIDYLSGTTISIESVSEPLNLAFEILGGQESAVAEHQQRLEEHRQTVQQQQQEIDSTAEQIHNQWQGWHEAQTALDNELAELKVKQSTLDLTQDYAQTLRHYLQDEYNLQESLKQLGGSASVEVPANGDLSELEQMPLENLPTEVQNLQQDLQNLFPFVIGQVEELVEEQQSNEQEAYQMLYETLVGQWRNLLQLQGKLTEHQAVLGRKLQLPEPPTPGSQSISVEPLVSKIDGLRQSQTEKLQTLEHEVTEIESNVQEIQDRLNQQSSDQQAKQDELKQQEQALLEQRRSLAELSGQVSLYEQMLQPQQEKLAELRQKLETAVESLNQFQETGNYQQQAIGQIRDVVMSLVNPPAAE